MVVRSMASHRESFGSPNWCSPPEVAITRVAEVINPTRQLLYETARKEVLQRNPQGCTEIPGIKASICLQEGGVDLNECLLFHGCPCHVADQVARDGLDPQRGGESAGALFGRGTYFAQNASKSDLYTTCSECQPTTWFRNCNHATAERCLIIARVLLGESKLSSRRTAGTEHEHLSDLMVGRTTLSLL